MKKLSDDDILKWLKSDEKANFNAKNRSKPIKKYPKPNQITRETLRKILKGKIKLMQKLIYMGWIGLKLEKRLKILFLTVF